MAGLTSCAALQPGDANAMAGFGAVPTADVGWAREALKDFWSEDKQSEIKARASVYARMLDTDLASMRSISPSAAYSVQMDRTLKREIRAERNYLERTIRKYGGGLL